MIGQQLCGVTVLREIGQVGRRGASEYVQVELACGCRLTVRKRRLYGEANRGSGIRCPAKHEAQRQALRALKAQQKEMA
jgi:hypothetical protein